MSTTPGLEKSNLLESLALKMDTPPWDAAYRIAIGFALLPLFSRVWGEELPVWALGANLLGALLLLRIIPAVLRKLIPVSDQARQTWAERRQIAKRYDSYQWRKLFWIGSGMAIYAASSGDLSAPNVVIALLCLCSGAVGLARWRIHSSRMHPRTAPAKDAHVAA
jgi:hypothetical protein